MAKSGVDYFPLDVTLNDNFKLIEAEFGLTGFGVVVKLYQKIYGGRGYYTEWTNEVALLFAREIGLGGNAVSEIVRASIKRGIFDETLGQYGKGNIDLYNRPQYKYPDGLTATVESALFTIDGEYVLLPTIDYDASGNAIRLTDDEAVQRYVKTGEYLGKFGTQEEADAYANKLHLAQDYYYSDNKDEYTDNGKWGLTKDAAKILWGVDFGTEDEETIADIKEQKRAGGVIAALMGTAGTAFDVGDKRLYRGTTSESQERG